MHLIKVGAAVLNQTPLAWDQNAANIRRALAEARAANVSILCLPEMCISGYGCEDAFQSPGVWQTSWEMLQELLPETQGLMTCFGLPIFHQDSVYNAVAMVNDGRIAGFVAKRFLAGDGIHYEPRWFKPWPAGVTGELRRNGESWPLGDLHFRCESAKGPGVSVGFEICEDAWVAQRPGSRLALAGVDVILNPSASHFAFGKRDIRRRFVLEGSRAFGVSYVYANLLGNEAGRAIYDGGPMIASNGQMLASGPRFSFEDVQLSTAVVDIDLTRMNHARIASFVPDLTADPTACVRIPFEFPELDDSELSEVAEANFSPQTLPDSRDAWEMSPHLKQEEFSRAVALALYDYLRKSRSRGFVISLSGGADSAACAVLVKQMISLGLKDLGPQQFLQKLGYIKDLENTTSEHGLAEKLLTTAYQATSNSGDVTRNAARAVAAAVGATHYEFSVDELVQGYRSTIETAIDRPLTWEQDDITLQNIQARVRAPSVWMLANINNALLLSTSNRSEAAVGYATMDGDTSGGLSPIAGIDKAFLRNWLEWVQRHGLSGGEPMPVLSCITAQAPTAELRPEESGQTDEADLMPYPLLDAIERAAIRDKQMPREVLRYMQAEFPEYTREQLVGWVEKFFQLWCRNQWKRERYAPSFHLDDKNLDPKTWCRFPILSGGFQRELRALRT